MLDGTTITSSVYKKNIDLSLNPSKIRYGEGTTIKKRFFTMIAFCLLLLIQLNFPANATIYKYNVSGRLSSVTYDNGLKVTYEYDANGNLRRVTKATVLCVYRTDPADGVSNMPVDKTVYVTFSKNIRPGDSYSGICVKTGATVVDITYNISGSLLVVDPIQDLSYSTTYAVYIPAGAVKDEAENSLEQAYSFDFTTIKQDVYGPVVSELTPADNSLVNNPSPEISALVSDPEGIDAASITFKLDGSVVKHAYDSATGKVSYTPPGILTQTAHTVDLSVKDISGNVTIKGWGFSVKYQSPVIVNTDPVNNDTNVALDKTITVNFDENVQQGSAFNSITLKDVNLNLIPAATNLNGSVLTIDPNADLSLNTAYFVSIPAGAVKDSYNNDCLGYTFTFTTAYTMFGRTERASVSSSGAQADSASIYAAVSRDGRYVAFSSWATNLVSGDTNGWADAFVRDLQAGSTVRVSVGASGVQANNNCVAPSISAGQQYVTFISLADNLIEPDTNSKMDVFLYDQQVHSVSEIVSGYSTTNRSNDTSSTSSVTVNGEGVVAAFQSYASNLVSDDTNGKSDIFVYQRNMVNYERASVAGAGIQANGDSLDPFISADGKYVAFYSSASNLVSGDTNGLDDVFVRDRQAGRTERVSVSGTGAQANGSSRYPSISADGRYVVFNSGASNLVLGDTNGRTDVFIHDRQTGQTERVSISTAGAEADNDSTNASVSDDGRYVAFHSVASNLVPGDTNGKTDVFVRDRRIGQTIRVSVSNTEEQGNDSSYNACISSDGSRVAFESSATNLVPGDTNNADDIFVRFLAPSDSSLPVISGTDPVDGATGVPVERAINVTFNKNIQQGSTFSSISLKDAGSSVVPAANSINGSVLTIGPDASLADNNTYTVTIPAGAVTDNAGNVLAQVYEFSFTTSDANGSAVSSLTPVDESQINNARPEISAVTTDPSGIDTASIVLKVDGIAVGHTFNLSTGKLSYTPASALADGRHTVGLSVYDGTGNCTARTWSFTVDTVPPAVSGTNPADNATNVLANKIITVAFAENVQEGLAFDSITLKDADNSPVESVKNLSGNSLAIDPVADLGSSMIYTVSIPQDGVKDEAGNSFLNGFIFTFTTTMNTSKLIISSQPDWQAGTVKTHIDTTTSPGDIKIAQAGTNFSETDTLTADFNGTHSNTQAVGDAVKLPASPVISGYGITALGTPWDAASSNTFEYGWKFTVGSVALPVTKLRLWMGNSTGSSIEPFPVHIWDSSSGTKLAEVNITPCGVNCTYWVEASLMSPIILQANTSYVISVQSGPPYSYIPKSTPIYSNYITCNEGRTGPGGSMPTNVDTWAIWGIVDFYYNTADVSSYGTYTHNVQDISCAGIAGNTTITYNKTTPTGTDLTVEVRTSPDGGSTWGAWTAKNSGDIIIPEGTDLTGYKVQWRANLSTTDSSQTPSLDDVNVTVSAGYYSSAEWISPVYDLGETPTAATLTWTETRLANTSVAWKVQASVDNLTWGGWQDVISPGDSMPLGRYIQVKTVLSTTEANATPVVRDFTVAYYINDSEAPAVSGTDPADGAVDVPISKTINLDFNETIRAGNNYEGIAVTDVSDNNVSVTKSISGNTLTIDHIENFNYSTTYTVTIPSGAIQDVAGNAMNTSYTFGFTTLAPLDTTVPVVVGTNPANQSTNVPNTQTIIVTFSENVTTGGSFDSITIKDESNNTVPMSKSVGGSTLTVDPDGDLSYNMTYTVTIPAGAVEDAAGNALYAPYTFSFTTVAPPDVPPTVISTDPANGAVNVPINKTIVVTFSENIQSGPNYGNIALKNGTLTVAVNCSINGALLSIDPVQDLDQPTAYSVYVPAGAVRDYAGNGLVADYIFSFTKVSEAKTVLVSLSSGGSQGDADSANPSISADGRYVAFDSVTRLVSEDSASYKDIFVRNLQTNQTERVSVSNGGSQSQGASWNASINQDGRYVAFASNANNLVSNDTNGITDVFVRDRQAATTERVSVASSGTQANDGSYLYYLPSISGDGRYVAFYSLASNLVSGDTNGQSDVFVRDRQTGQTYRVSKSSAGTQGNGGSDCPSISSDGRYVVFNSYASNLVSGDTNNTVDVFIHDRQTGQTERVSVTSGGAQLNYGGLEPSVSADGRYVAFITSDGNLVSGDTNNYADVFVRDRQTGLVERMSVSTVGAQANNWSDAPCISPDGRYVTFWSNASNLVSGDTNGITDVFVHDRQTGNTERVSISSAGVQANQHNGSTSYPSISQGGRYVAFQSSATNLAAGDTNGKVDIFVRTRW
ncbi:MAG: Ig-like domain-containing protein [Bacillota bacterium]